MQYLLTVALTAGAICASASSIPTDNLAFVETFAEDVFATQRWKKSTNGRYESQKVEISAPDTAPEGFQVL
jgi:putative lipoic acid-binding regulatory protein